MVGLKWSKDPEGNPGGSVATGRVSNVGQVKGDDPEEKGYSGPSGWGMGVGPTALPRQKLMSRQPKRRLG